MASDNRARHRFIDIFPLNLVLLAVSVPQLLWRVTLAFSRVLDERITAREGRDRAEPYLISIIKRKLELFRRTARIARVLLIGPSEFQHIHRVAAKLADQATAVIVHDETQIITICTELALLRAKFGDELLVIAFCRPIRISAEEYRQFGLAVRMMHLAWRYHACDVIYTVDLDGGGTSHAQVFVGYLRQRFPNRVFSTALEWCSGPGFIGFALLQSGICANLVLADINPEAIKCVEETVRLNKLGQSVRAVVSDNLGGLDPSEQFDLVVGNPPWSYSRNNLNNPLIANDPGWALRRRFYLCVRSFLTQGAIVCISEFRPFDVTALGNTSEHVWDIRPCVPHVEFLEMITHGGLTHVETVAPEWRERGRMGYGMWFVVSANSQSIV